MLHVAMKLALELGITMTEFLALPASEFYQWRAYFSLTKDDFAPSVDDQLRAAFSQMKERHV